MEQAMNYPVVIHKDRKSDYGVSVPDLPGCISAGATVDEALAMLRRSARQLPISPPAVATPAMASM